MDPPLPPLFPHRARHEWDTPLDHEGTLRCHRFYAQSAVWVRTLTTAQNLLHPSTPGGTQQDALYDLQMEANKTHVKDLRQEHRSLAGRCPDHPFLLHIQAVEADTLRCLLAASHADWGDARYTTWGCFKLVENCPPNGKISFGDFLRLRGPRRPQTSPPLPLLPEDLATRVYAFLSLSPSRPLAHASHRGTFAGTPATGLMDGPTGTNLTPPLPGRGGIRRLPPTSNAGEQTLRQTRARHSGGGALPTTPPTDPVGRVRHWVQNTRVRRHPNEGLGNCLFLAVSQALTEQGHARNHLDLRQEVARYIQAHADALIHAWDWQMPEAPDTARPCRDINEYIEALRRPGAWGGSLELAAMASMFPAKAIMVLGPQSHPMVLGDRQRPIPPVAGNRIALWYHGNHYERISSEIPGWIWGMLWEEGAPHADPVDPPPEAPREPPVDEPRMTTVQLPFPEGEGGAPIGIDEVSIEGTPPCTPDPQLPLAAAPPMSHSGNAPPREDPRSPPIEAAIGSAEANKPIHEEISHCTPEAQPASAGTSTTHYPVNATSGKGPPAPAPQPGPETEQDRRPEHPTALPMAQPHTLGQWLEDLRQTAKLLTAQGLTWWQSAPIGTVGTLLCTVHGQKVEGKQTLVNISILPPGPPNEQGGKPDDQQTQATIAHTSVDLRCFSEFSCDLPSLDFRTYRVVFATKVSQSPLSLQVGPQTNPLSGIFPVVPDTQKTGVADLACGIGGFSYASLALGWPVAVAVDRHPQATQAYSSIHTAEHPCIQADLADPHTLWEVAAKRPEIVCLGFPCQPYSAAGYQRGFLDPRSQVLHVLLTYAAVLAPKAMALECVKGFATMDRGSCVRQLKDALLLLQPAFHTQGEVACLRAVRPIRRARWLAACIRLEEWRSLPSLPRQNITAAGWTPRPSSLTGLGIPDNRHDTPDLMLPGWLALRYTAPAYLPQGFHSRFVQDWEAIPAFTHSMGSEFGPCPCGCRNGGLSDAHLREQRNLCHTGQDPRRMSLPFPHGNGSGDGLPQIRFLANGPTYPGPLSPRKRDKPHARDTNLGTALDAPGGNQSSTGTQPHSRDGL